jgi:hypothetical protein
LLLVPLLGLIASPSQTALLPRVRRALLLTALSVAVCLPWTARNCARLESCVLVSANGGWNLFIGTAREGGGGWVPLDRIGVPEECKTVFGEAEKDACFGRAGLRRIAAEPLAWLSLVPAKLKMTFDYSGAAAYYLHASNGEAFSERARALLGGIEVGYQRLLALLGLGALARVPGQHARPRRALALLGAVGLLLPLAWLSHLASCGSALLLGAALWRHPAALTAAAVVATASLVHAIFFGAGRYGLVVTGAMAALAGLVAGCRAEMKLASDRAF